MSFDTEQLKAIEANDLNEIILAVAGSGKTTTTIACALRAINHPAITKQLSDKALMQPLNPKHIRVASFTNIAADTFRERINYQSQGDADDIRISTLDKFAIEIIKHVYPNVQIDQNEDIVARTLYYDLNNITQLQSKFLRYSSYIKFITDAANSFIASDKAERKIYYEDYFNDYIKHLINTKKTSDQFTVPLSKIYTFAIITMIQHQFIPEIELFIVDEIQDTSGEQFNFLSFLRTQLPKMRFIGVGDISQSMYRWNKAQPERVSNFIQDFNAKIYTLPNNYRSNPEIIDYANTMLENNLDNISGVTINAKSKKKHQYVENRVNYQTSVFKMLEDIQFKITEEQINPNEIAIISRHVKPLKKIIKMVNKSSNLTIPLDMSQQENNKDIKFYEYVLRYFALTYAYVKDNQFDNDLLDEFYDKMRKYHLLDMINHDLKYYRQIVYQNKPKFNREFGDELKTLRQLIEHKMSLSMFNSNKTKEQGVRLSTVHGIKGDEYRYVYYIPEKNSPLKHINPEANLTTNEKELFWGDYAERQNIHYVAITRAIDQFTLVDYENNFPSDLEEIEKAKIKDQPYNIDTYNLLKPFENTIKNTILSDDEIIFNKEMNSKERY